MQTTCASRAERIQPQCEGAIKQWWKAGEEKIGRSEIIVITAGLLQGTVGGGKAGVPPSLKFQGQMTNITALCNSVGQ